MEPEFSDEDVARIHAQLDAKGAKRKPCPWCNAQEWEVGGGRERFFIPGMAGDENIGALHAIALICTNCGFVRLHADHVLLSDD